MQSIRMVREELNPDLEVGGVLLTMFDPRTNLAHQVADEVRSFFGERVFHELGLIAWGKMHAWQRDG